MSGLSPTEKGAIAELAIAHAAAEAGIVVSRPMVEGRRYDLIFDVGGELLRVQCKWARRRGDVVCVRLVSCRHTPHGYVKTVYGRDEIDAIAAYCPDLRTCYFLTLDALVGRHQLHLRLSPAKNHQRVGVKMAAEYQLGAIAQLGERRHGMAEVEGSSPSSSIEKAAS